MTFARLWTIPTLAAGILAPAPAPAPGSGAPPVELRRVPNGGIQPEVVVGPDGVLHMLYFAGDARTGDLFYVRSRDDGATFSPPVRVNSQAGSAIAAGTIRGGQLAVGAGGRLHVVWNGSEGAVPQGPPHRQTGTPGMPLLYTRSGADGTGFEPQRNLMRDTWALDGGGSVAADRDGHVFVTWHGQSAAEEAGDERTRRVWVARSADEGRTFARERAAWDRPGGACACCGMRAFSASNGTLFLLYRSAARGLSRDVHLLTSTDRGQSFRGDRIHAWSVAACPMTSMSMAESGGRVLGAWETSGDVYLGALDGRSEPRSPGAGSSGRKHPRLAVGKDGHVLLVWSEGTGWARGGSVAWQVFDASGRPVGERRSKAGVPVWSFATAAATPAGGFVVFY